MKLIRFPKRKSLKYDLDIQAFISQVDYNTDQLDREFREFQRQYGIDKGIDDWMDHIKKEQKNKVQELELRSKILSTLFKKKLNSYDGK
ncbi:hypothetical protein DB313_05895 (plasmid) [Borrelia turcica IST7]|uniref:Uncharacterized protein n=1 Tax=Borrelia turcica IST7 TaxID=1104446 RepID=A0A386PR87_9SPIR|nr:hypothetical protein [Borrelia turcica]AYE37030.1 hypothetical protein DB313_05895 [Borrelia turcica IST7]